MTQRDITETDKIIINMSAGTLIYRQCWEYRNEVRNNLIPREFLEQDPFFLGGGRRRFESLSFKIKNHVDVRISIFFFNP